MKAEDQNIAIAEACGIDVKICPVHRSRVCCGRGYPNYLNDLNACHEMEKVLNDAQMTKFTEKLFFHCAGANDEREFFICHATAAQRCEAFLRALGLWKANI